MDTTTLMKPHELRGRNAKAQRYAVPYPPNYIDAELPPGYRDPMDRRDYRSVKKKKVEHHEHYICIFMDDNGSWSVRSSESLKPVRKLVHADSMPHIESLFTGSEPRLDDIKDEQESQHQLEPVQPPPNLPRASTISYPFATSKRRRAASESTVGGVQSEVHPPSTGLMPSADVTQPKAAAGRKKPRRERVMLRIRMDEREKWFEWMRNAFKAIQQTACRSIAKEWIKAIHPKKQSTHPYNGNMPRTTHKSPDRTRPPYWPTTVRHKEPDHIDKAARTELLAWLLMHTPQPEIVPDKDKKTDKSFKAKDLLAVLEQKQDEFVMPRMDMIREVIEMRTRLEYYEEGGVDGEGYMDVVDWSENFRNATGGKKRKEDPNSAVKTEDEAEAESNDQEDEETSGAVLAADMSEDEKAEADVLGDPLEVNVSGSFMSDSSPQNDEIQPEQTTRLHHVDPFHHMTSNNLHGFTVPQNQIEHDPIRMNQHSHLMHFHPHHGLPNGNHYTSRNWSIASAPTPGLNGSFGEGMMMVQTPGSMVDQNQYEGRVAVRPRVVNGMVAANLFQEDQHYPYGVDQDLHSSFHMAQMNGAPHDNIHHGFDDELYSNSTAYGHLLCLDRLTRHMLRPRLLETSTFQLVGQVCGEANLLSVFIIILS